MSFQVPRLTVRHTNHGNFNLMQPSFGCVKTFENGFHLSRALCQNTNLRYSMVRGALGYPLSKSWCRKAEIWTHVCTAILVYFYFGFVCTLHLILALFGYSYITSSRYFMVTELCRVGWQTKQTVYN